MHERNINTYREGNLNYLTISKSLAEIYKSALRIVSILAGETPSTWRRQALVSLTENKLYIITPKVLFTNNVDTVVP